MDFPPLRLLVPFGLGCLLLACGGDDAPDVQITPISSLTETPGEAVPGLVLTPQAGVEVDFETAEQLEAEGDIEAATAAYVAVAAQDGDDRVPAKLAGTRLLLELSRYDDARLLVEPFVEERGPGEATAALYLLARAYSGLEQWKETAELYDRYIAEGGVAAPYAHLDRSYALLELQRTEDAIEAVQSGLELGVPADRERTYVMATAQSYERAGDFPAAIEWYYRLIEESGWFGDVSFALSRIVALKQLVDDESYTDDLMRLLTEYPASAQARTALSDALAAGEDIPPNVRGLVHYRHNEYSAAEEEFREQIEAAPEEPESAMAYYYLAAILEAWGELDDALKNYEQVDIINNDSPLEDNALWWRARVHELEGDLEDAGDLYERIVREQPDSEFASDAAFRRGMLAYHDSRFSEAAAIWEEDLQAVTEGGDRNRLLLWQAKALDRAGDAEAAAAVLDTLEAGSDGEYFGIRAANLREGGHGHPKAAVESDIDLAPDWDWQAAEEWLLEHAEVPELDRSWESDERWLRVHELWQVGRNAYARDEIFALFHAYAGNTTALYTLTRELAAEGRAAMSMRAGVWLLNAIDATPADGLPRELMSLAYPAAFGEMVEVFAEAEGISPLLLLAFIRQESQFEPRAISPAGALGLTQVMPATANEIARDLGVNQEVPRDQMLHAELNLRMGAYYMASQLENFDEEIFVALAAYNAGPGSAWRWREAIEDDDGDLFVETVEFEETRRYLEVVSENYAIYRYIYGGEPEPNLPR